MKRLLTCVISLALLLSLTACGTGTAPPENAGDSDTPGTQSEDAPAAGEKITLKIAGTIDPSIDERNKLNYEWIDSASKAYMDANPHVEVVYEAYKYDQIDTKLMTDFAAGIERGVSMISDSQLVEHYKAGDLVDLTPYFEAWDQADQEDFLWLGNLDAFRNEGRLYALPLEMHVRTIAYRKDLFAEAGLDASKPPKDLDELVEMAKTLTKDDVYGLGVYLGNERATNEVTYSPYLWYYGGELFDDSTKMATFASPQGIQAAQFLSDLVNVHGVTPEYMVSGGYDDILTGFVNGEFAMIDGFGNYWFNTLETEGLAEGLSPPTPDAVSDTVGLMIAPTGSSRYVNYWTMGISATCQHQDEAAELLKTLLEAQHLEKYLGGLPPRQTMLNTPSYQTEMYQIMSEAAGLGRQMPMTPNYMNLADAVAAAVQEIVMTNGDAEEILTRHQEEYNARYGGE